MNEDRTTKKFFNTQPIGTRRRDRPNLRWIDGLEKDLLVLRTRNWRTLAGRRLAWKRVLEKAKAHPGLPGQKTRGCHVISSSPVPLKTRRVEEADTNLNLSRLKRPSVGVEIRRGGCHLRLVTVAEWSRYQIVAGLVTSSSPVPLKTRCVGERCTFNLSRAQTSSLWCGVVVRRGGASSGVVHVT
ncbi:uncharacterized protein TNCV_3865451 [Trichonephila clavipes]|nr:uncharacterized protein TNCV_3865451 [Trichonephila clavipes]